MVTKPFKGHSGIDEHLSARGDGFPISINELDHFIAEVCAHTKLSEDQSRRIIEYFFQEIRSAMLQGKKVDIRSLGSFFISSPATTGNIKKIVPSFKAKKSLIKKMNNDSD
jgi:nucleoid DNA-binding protein